MVEKKKIVFVGPSGVGKTTIKNVFFEMANPLYLLKNSIPPTRGFNSTSYHFQDDEVGVFDLAGQENENWFNQEREIFAYTNLIICVLDVNSYLNDTAESWTPERGGERWALAHWLQHTANGGC